ncbi:MAG: arginine--tRNA ligase [Candidatus Paceibacterota bacterium]
MVKVKIINYLKEVVKEPVSIEVFVPDNEKFGHYSTNVALKLAKLRKQNSMTVAEEIKSVLSRVVVKDFFKKIEIAPPGFINFWLSEKTLQDKIKEILKKEKKYGQQLKAKSSKLKAISIEFISANPTGPLTIGNGRGGFLGDALANILKFQGNKVVKEYYINDAKASTQIRELGKTAVGIGKSYKTKDLELKIKKLGPKKAKNYSDAGYLLAKIIQEDNKKFIENKLKIKFDKWFSEENLYKSGAVEKLLGELKKKNLIYKKDDAIWFKSKQFGDNEDRVLVRQPRVAGQAGEPTYFLPDLAYHLNKFKIRKFNKVIDIWGADHHGYSPRLKAGLKAFGIADEKLKIIISQLVRLIKKGKETKMSKRKGEYVSLEELIDEVGLDAARFFFLMYSPNTHMDFDLDLAKEKSLENPVYYVQYAAVRCDSILKKPKFQSPNSKQIPKPKFQNLKLLNTKEDLNLIRMLVRFPEIIEEAAQNYSPQILVRYSLDLARQFHNFYEKEHIIADLRGLNADQYRQSMDFMFARLALIQATLVIFKNTFNLLGITLPKKM